MSRNIFIYGSFSLGAVGVFALLLNAALASIIESQSIARTVTALIVAFAAGAMSAISVIYFGAQIRGQKGERATEQPPRKLFVYQKATNRLEFGAVTSPLEIVRPHTIQAVVKEEAPTPMIENGIAHILETPSRRKNSNTVEWAEKDPSADRFIYRTVDIQTLRRFARLHTPARSEWSGRNATYSECLAFFRFAGWVVPTTEAGKGVEWVMQYKKPQRRLAYLGDLADISQAPPLQAGISKVFQPA